MKRLSVALGALAVLLIVSFALGGNSSGSAKHAARASASASATIGRATPFAGEKVAAPDQAASSGSGSRTAAGTNQPGSPQPSTATSGAPSPGVTSPGDTGGTDITGVSGVQLVKTAAIDLGVAKGKVSDTIGRLTQLATGVGGAIINEQTQEYGGSPNGTITLQVPQASYDAVVKQIRLIGKVRSATASAQDVTGQVADIDARLRTLNNEYNQLQLILGQATQIPDILNVRDRLNAVQTEIEQLKGQQAVLDHQVKTSTITVTVSELGATPIPIEVAGQGHTGFSGAWHDAVDGFNHGLQRIIAGSGQAIVILGSLLVIGLVARAGWRYKERRSPQPPAPSGASGPAAPPSPPAPASA